MNRSIQVQSNINQFTSVGGPHTQNSMESIIIYDEYVFQQSVFEDDCE